MGIVGYLRFSGVAACAMFWVLVAECVRRNPWFDLLRDAFSDLGAAGATDPWLYNRGLVTVAALMAALSIHMILTAEGKMEVVGGTYMSVAALFLALIGAFPSGTKPHGFVSSYFFVQAFAAVLAHGLGRARRDRIYCAGQVTASSLALAGLAVGWPSAAVAEAYEIALLGAATVMYAARAPGGSKREAAGGSARRAAKFIFHYGYQ